MFESIMNSEFENQQIASAVALYQQGNVPAAIVFLSNTIAQHPHFIEAHFYLACFLQAHNQPIQALQYYGAVLQAKPHHIDALINSGNVCITQNQLNKALDFYNQALAIQPLNLDLLNNRGHLLTTLKQHDEALASLNQALSINPDHINVLNNKGFLLCQLGQHEEALLAFNHALSINPQDMMSLCNRYSLLIRLKRPEEALVDCYRVLAVYPNHLDTLKAAVNSLMMLKRHTQATEMIHRALIIEPNNDDLLYAQATLFKITRQYDQSLISLNKLLALKPNHISALVDRGNIHSALNHLENAVADFDRVIAIEPENVAAWMNKAIVFNKCRLHELAILCYQHVVAALPNDAGAHVAVLLHMQHLCDWSSMDVHIHALKDILAKEDYLESDQLSRAMPSTLLSIPHITPQEQRLFAQKYTSITAFDTPTRVFHQRESNEKIHIGYFSGDFNQHPVSQLMVEVLELHNRDQFMISAYSAKVTDNSLLRKRVEKSVDHFVDISKLSDAMVIEKIMADKVDILVDLSGYTEASRSELLALRPAPIQVNYLGFLGTMGADFIDYLIADDFLVPAGSESFYSEKIIRLPSYQANDRQCVIGEKPSRASCGLPEQAIVFCCFNINYKITADVFDVWCRLLNNISDSVLWLFANDDVVMNNLRKEATQRGINPERLVFAPWVDIDEHLARIACADLFLDTAPYNAGTTASNALWAGLPVVTCAGETFSSRMAGSLLTALNVPELITYTLDSYYQLAYELATQHEKRNNLRQKIIANKNTSLLFDSSRFVRNLEKAYHDMIDSHMHTHFK